MLEKKMTADCGGEGDSCCTPSPLKRPTARVDDDVSIHDAACCVSAVDASVTHQRRVLWAVLAINSGMFAVELGAGLMAGSASLQADALDFLGDAANYAISLAVIGMSLRVRSGAALVKGVSMGALALWVLVVAGWHAWQQTLPQAFTMGAVGISALIANAVSFALLWRYRSGDANMHSAWICTRNDVLGNCAVLLAAAGVFGAAAGWPDLVVATVMAALGLQGARAVIQRAVGGLIQPSLVVAKRHAG
jgi:Co/Zn/Cd efflux system component